MLLRISFLVLAFCVLASAQAHSALTTVRSLPDAGQRDVEFYSDGDLTSVPQLEAYMSDNPNFAHPLHISVVRLHLSAFVGRSRGR